VDVAQSFHLRALRIAARQLGGEPQLRAYLTVPASDLYRWMRGQEPVPQDVMTRVIAFLAEREAAANPSSDSPAAPVAGQKQNLV
jgi:hypothetical protein